MVTALDLNRQTQKPAVVALVTSLSIFSKLISVCAIFEVMIMFGGAGTPLETPPIECAPGERPTTPPPPPGKRGKRDSGPTPPTVE